eukprot:scaffold24203_cov127-Cylindrotheca_fusiformis.AAC.2
MVSFVYRGDNGADFQRRIVTNIQIHPSRQSVGITRNGNEFSLGIGATIRPFLYRTVVHIEIQPSVTDTVAHIEIQPSVTDNEALACFKALSCWKKLRPPKAFGGLGGTPSIRDTQIEASIVVASIARKWTYYCNCPLPRCDRDTT